MGKEVKAVRKDSGKLLLILANFGSCPDNTV